MGNDEYKSFDKAVDEIREEVEREQRYRYSLKVIQEAYNPVNVGRMTEPDAAAEITGPCGDTMEFYLRVRSGVIEDITFYTDGCGSTIACGSMATRLAKGKYVEEAGMITNQDIIDALDGLPEENLHCAKLAADTLRKVIRIHTEEKA
jgi:nitrogen fixation NifU-like protein